MNKLILIVVIVSIGIISVSTSFAGLSDGLVAYFPFISDANDESGNGNDGTVNGASLTSDRFGNPNSAYDFDGLNDYIRIEDSATLRLSNYSIGAWINVQDSAAYDDFEMIVERKNAYAFGTYFDGLNSELYAATNDSTWYEYSSDYVVPLEIWKHVAVTFDSGTINFYENGSIKNTITGAVIPNNSPNWLAIGADPAVVDLGLNRHYFDGVIDDVRIYNRTLSQSEIQQIAVVPEPISSTLFIVGGATLGFRRFRKTFRGRK